MISLNKKKIYESIKKNIIDKLQYIPTIKESTIIVPFVTSDEVQKYVDYFNASETSSDFQYLFNAADNSLIITTAETNAPSIQQMISDIEEKGFDKQQVAEPIAAAVPSDSALTAEIPPIPMSMPESLKESFVVVSKDKKDPNHVVEKELGTYNSEEEADAAVDALPVVSTTRYIIRAKKV